MIRRLALILAMPAAFCGTLAGLAALDGPTFESRWAPVEQLPTPQDIAPWTNDAPVSLPKGDERPSCELPDCREI